MAAIQLVGREAHPTPTVGLYPTRARYSVEVIKEYERESADFETLDQACTFIRSVNANAWSIRMNEYAGEWDGVHHWMIWDLDVDPYSVI